MKYRQGGEIAVGDYVICKSSGGKGTVHSIDDKCGILKVCWEGYYFVGVRARFSSIVRPKSIRPAEPEELI